MIFLAPQAKILRILGSETLKIVDLETYFKGFSGILEQKHPKIFACGGLKIHKKVVVRNFVMKQGGLLLRVDH